MFILPQRAYTRLAHSHRLRWTNAVYSPSFHSRIDDAYKSHATISHLRRGDTTPPPIPMTTTARRSTAARPLMLHAFALLSLVAITSGQLATTRVLADNGSGEVTLVFRDANFSSWKHENVTYQSSTGYNAKGMAPLYKIANQVISLFVGKTVLPDGKFGYMISVHSPKP